MRLAICGTDDKALKLKKLFDENLSDTVKITMLIGQSSPVVENIKTSIVSEKEILNTNYSEYLDGFVISPEYYGLIRMNIYKKLKSSFYASKKIFMPDFATLQSQSGVGHINLNKLLVPYEDAPQLFYLEVHAADHCNLNCKGCMHFSSLINEEVFPDINRLNKDINQLKKIIRHIDIIRILGGEPLLNPELDQYIILLRKAYPYANINIVTNGGLVEKMSVLLCNTIRENKVHVHVSLYPPLKNRKNEIEDFLKEQKLIYQVSECIETFTSTYQLRPFANKGYAKEHCEIFCNNLRDGKISCCPNVIYTHYFNEHFGTVFPVEDGMIDIYKIKSAKELHRNLNKPNFLCSYCDRTTSFAWDISKKKQSEWLSMDYYEK